MSLRAIANSLRVSCDAVRKNALKIGLPLKRPGRPRSLSTNAYRHLLISKSEKRQKKVNSARKRWVAALERLPDCGMRVLRGKLPSVYMILWRYDRAWLKIHQPPRKLRRKQVDWAARDHVLVRKLELAAQVLNPTPCRIARAAGVNGWLKDKFALLPLARRKWEELCHSAMADRLGDFIADPSRTGPFWSTLLDKPSDAKTLQNHRSL